MKSHYGYIRGTVGKDKDHIDVFLKPGTEALTDDSPVAEVNGGDQPLVDLIRSGAGDRDILNFVAARWGIGGAGGNRYMVEMSAGPTLTLILEKDEGKERMVLKGPVLAKAIRMQFAVSLAEMKAAAGQEQRPETAPARAKKAEEKKSAVSENTIFTADAAERARALLRSKLNQLNSGIDPEIMQAGITLAGYHIERGARTFAAYASAMLADLGEVARPYLKSWYMGVKYDPRATAFDGMSSAAEVDAADVNVIEVGGSDESAKLESDGAGALEGTPAGAVSPVEGGGETGNRAGRGGRADLSRGDATGRERVQQRGGVADDARAVSSAARDAEGRNAQSDAGRAGGDALREADDAGQVEDFVRTPDGSLDFGEISPEIASAIKRQAGPIRLRHGNDAWGLVHIRQRHGAQIRASGFQSAEQFVSAVAGNFTAIYPRPGRSLDVVLDDGARGKLIVQLEPSQSDGDFYDVKTATPIRADQYKNGVPLWERTGPSTPSAETDSLDPWDHSGTGNSVTGRGKNVQSAAVPAQQQPADFAIAADDRIGEGGAKTKFANNVAAIKLLVKLGEEARPATRGEQAVLAKWVGWGGLRSLLS